MLLRLRFANHASFAPDGDDLHELSWVATRGSDHPDHPRDLPGLAERALPVVALYGGNASGKSNALAAIETFRWHVVHSYPDLKPGDRLKWTPFKLDATSLTTPTTFDADLVVGGVRYRYGFRATADAVLAEWLHAWPNGRQQVWFEREGPDPATWRFGPHWRFAGGSRADLVQRAGDNRLLLSVAGTDKHPMVEPIYLAIAAISRRPTETIAYQFMLFPGSPLLDETRRPQLEALLRAADVGAASYRIVSGRRRLLERASDDGLSAEQVSQIASSFERHGEPQQLLLLHRSADGDGRLLEPEEESDGTRALVNLLHYALVALRDGSLLLVDELDRALHTRLAAELVRLFTSPDSNPHGAQLLLTTHDNGLLDVLRRDEIVFVDKDNAGCSTLTPASDFHLHKRDSARALYESGRLGGVPRVTSMSRALRTRLPVEGADGEA
jgi:hypothetical protein